MKTSSKGLKLISQREANILHWYLDSSGYPTIGVGHLIVAGDKWKKGDTITLAESLALLKIDAARMENAVNKNVSASMTQNQFDALVSLTFNIGASGIAHSSVVRLFNAGRTQQAADAILKWNKSAGHVVQGLINRRRAERLQFLQPDNITQHDVIIAAPTLVDNEPPHPIIAATFAEPIGQVEEGQGLAEDGSFYGKTSELIQAKTDNLLKVGNALSSRTDSAKSIWATIGGTILQIVMAIGAFLAAVPKEMWIVLALIIGAITLMYLHRQNKLGAIREWAGHRLLGGDTKAENTVNVV